MLKLPCSSNYSQNSTTGTSRPANVGLEVKPLLKDRGYNYEMLAPNVRKELSSVTGKFKNNLISESKVY